MCTGNDSYRMYHMFLVPVTLLIVSRLAEDMDYLKGLERVAAIVFMISILLQHLT